MPTFALARQARFLSLLLVLYLPFMANAANVATVLASLPVRADGSEPTYVAEGVVEALRQTVLSAQISGAVTELLVKPGDVVKSGQLLLRIDARAANQEAKASQAQVDAARATMLVAAKDFDRQKQLFAKNYISQAQLDRAEAQYQTASAQAKAQIAQASAVQTQSGFYLLNAPYSGVVSDVPVTVGDMALPGRTLVTVYDPRAMRVTANVPQEKLAQFSANQTEQAIRIEIPGAAEKYQSASKITILPVADAMTHSVQVRLDLPTGITGLTPGMFARAMFHIRSAVNLHSVTRLYVPVKSVMRRAEMHVLYVLNAQGKPILRQVRLGPVNGQEVEILSGISAGESVLLDPLAVQITSSR
ncbi:efflux RND transporter periplasmic adaptor subunit [Undibacterium sp. SXout7W]|uniref:efflux RND transporter periplasmic adaptor subunit n=1 Tax=Undibacterium sp. SXout7W TaxID=3413049 RepID=UPI003BF1BD69